MGKQRKDGVIRSKLSYDGLQLLTRVPISIQRKLRWRIGDWIKWNTSGKKVILTKEVKDEKE